jgi:hypothetical protein
MEHANKAHEASQGAFEKSLAHSGKQ